MLIKRTERQARRGSLAAASPAKRTAASTAAPSCAAPASPPAASPPSARCRSPACARREAAAAGPLDRRRDHPQEHLHALLGRLHRHRRSRQRRVGRPGAELGFADQPRLALRQGRLGARTRARRAPAEISDEARRTANGRASRGTRRSTRSATSSMQIREKSGARVGLLARLGQDDQRGLLSVPQARRVLGHQQHRPPGAHLPFDDRHRRGQYLGLRRDDQQLQRHPQRQDAWSSWAAIRRKRIRCRMQHLLEGEGAATRRTSSSSIRA